MIIALCCKEKVVVWLLDMPALQHLYDSHRAARRSLRALSAIMLLIIQFRDKFVLWGAQGPATSQFLLLPLQEIDP
jgi:hypothetical protein